MPIVDLAPEVVRDQVARDDEEDVDADVPSGHGADVGVVEHDGDDGDRAQALDVLAEGAPPAARRLVSLQRHPVITPFPLRA